MASWQNLTPNDHELLSAYIDGELSDIERSTLEARLQSDAELRRELGLLRQSVAMVKELPGLQAPRNFTLQAEMVADKVPSRPRLLLFPTSRAFSTLSAVAAALLVIVGAAALLQQPPGDNSEVLAFDVAASDLTAAEQAPALSDGSLTITTETFANEQARELAFAITATAETLSFGEAGFESPDARDRDGDEADSVGSVEGRADTPADAQVGQSLSADTESLAEANADHSTGADVGALADEAPAAGLGGGFTAPAEAGERTDNQRDGGFSDNARAGTGDEAPEPELSEGDATFQDDFAESQEEAAAAPLAAQAPQALATTIAQQPAPTLTLAPATLERATPPPSAAFRQENARLENDNLAVIIGVGLLAAGFALLSISIATTLARRRQTR